MKMLILGDVSPTEQTAPFFAAEQTEALFGDVTELFKRSDFCFVNLECAITDSENAIKKFGPNLKAPWGTGRTLKQLGVDVCGLSNNHVFDFGREGAMDTLRCLEEAGIDYTGFGCDEGDSRRNYTISKDGQVISLITVCEHEYSYALPDRMGSRPYDPYDTMEDIQKAKESSDRVIVIYHGGKEFCRYPSPRVHKLTRAMIKNGADVVVCQHSHCIATYEQFEGGHILHGQGNFHFVRPNEDPGWNECVAVIYDTLTGEVELIPILGEGHSVRMADAGEKADILGSLTARSLELQNGQWRQGWHDFCLRMSANYQKAIGGAGLPDSTEQDSAFFAHYLDCEAHTDVWRELYPTYNQTNERE